MTLWLFEKLDSSFIIYQMVKKMDLKQELEILNELQIGIVMLHKGIAEIEEAVKKLQEKYRERIAKGE